MKKNKLIDGKRLNIVIDTLASKVLEKKVAETGICATKIIEQLLKTMPDGLGGITVQRVNDMMRFQKKFYLDLNATFNNLNQIAYHLNLAELMHFKEEVLNNELLENTLKQIQTNCDYLQELRILILQFQIILENAFGKKPDLTLLEKKYSQYLRRMVHQEAFKRGLIQDFIEELSDEEMKKMMEEMENF